MAVEQKNFYGDIVTLCLVTCENVGTLVTTRDEKTAPPIIASQVNTAETVVTVKTAKTEDLKKYQLLSDNLKARDATVSLMLFCNYWRSCFLVPGCH